MLDGLYLNADRRWKEYETALPEERGGALTRWLEAWREYVRAVDSPYLIADELDTDE